MKKTIYTLLLCLPALLCSCSSHNEDLLGRWSSQTPARVVAEEPQSVQQGFIFNPDGTFARSITLTDRGVPLAVAMVSGEWEYFRGAKLRDGFTALVGITYDLGTLRVEAMNPNFQTHRIQQWRTSLASRFSLHNDRQNGAAHNQPVYALRITRLNASHLLIDSSEGSVRLRRL